MNFTAATGRRAAIVLALAGAIGACSAPDRAVTIAFASHYGPAPIACDRDAGAVQMTDLRLYVSGVELVNEAGAAIPVELVADNQWQQADLALLDFETAVNGCENGTDVAFAELRGQVPHGNYRGLQFTVGVPFDRNHGDPLTAVPPLGDSAMHWSWRGGYKFLRAGVRTATDGFWVHLGSTGCEGRINAITGCAAPNRVTVALADYEPDQHTVVIDLAALFSGVDLADGEATDCSSGPAETQCAAVFAALGLDFETGGSAGEQRVFRAGTRQ